MVIVLDVLDFLQDMALLFPALLDSASQGSLILVLNKMNVLCNKTEVSNEK